MRRCHEAVWCSPLGRPTGYTLSLCSSATLREVSFSYDTLGRLATVASGTNVFAYSYLPGTDLVSGYTCGGFSRSVAYEQCRDLVSAITNRFGSRVISTFEYTNDAAGRRTAIRRGGEAMGPLAGAKDTYGYNGRNEVVSARRTLGGESVAGFNEDFAYDPIGNRISSTDYDETGAARTSTYTANNLNQYTARTVPGWASVRGLADANATVAVNGNLVYALASGDLAYFFGSDDFDNSAGGGLAELEVSAVVSDGTSDLVSVATNKVFVPPANETYAYDADGNQTLVTTGTGAWQVEYNGENRPVKWTRVSPDSSTPNSSTPTLISMAFDHQGRRRLYAEATAGVTNKLHRFTYDDYVCIARNREIDVQHGFGSDAFVWDPTEPIATRPLMCDLSGCGALLYCHDGNKNVSEAVTLDGTIAAHYEYSSFGKVVLVTSENEDQSTANLNPYRFSSEYADDALELVYYNHRHYEPMMGRWHSPDPLTDDVVVPYLFCKNSPSGNFDQLGLQSITGYVDPNVSGTWQRFGEYDDGFTAALPNCPCCIDVSGSSPTLEPKDASDAGWGRVNEANLEHPGATWEVRWVDPTGTLTQGQQCTYDNEGHLITKPPAAGTPDKVSYDGDKHSVRDLHFWGHFLKDWIPYKILPRNEYFKHWPPNNGNGCPENSGQ